MSCRSCSFTRLSASALARLAVPVGMLFVCAGSFPAPALSQTSPTQQQGPPDQSATTSQPKPPAEHATKPAPPPANPLVKINPVDGTGNDSHEYNPDGTRKAPGADSRQNIHDYRSGSDDIRNTKPARRLPRFGYDMFASARRLILQVEAAQGDPSGAGQGTTARTRRNSGQSSVYGSGAGNTRRTSIQGSGLSNGAPTTDLNDLTLGVGANGQPDGQNAATARRGTTAGDEQVNTGLPTGQGADDGGNAQSDQSDGTDGSGSEQSRAGGNANGTSSSADGSLDDGNIASTPSTYQQAEMLRQENLRRAANGLPPLVDTMAGSTAGRAAGSSTIQRRSSGNRYMTADNLGANGFTDLYGYGYNGEAGDQGPVAGFNNIVTPLTMMTQRVTATTPSTYQLSGGDEVVINYYNPVSAPVTLTEKVDTQGYLRIGRLTRINVAGMTLQMAGNAVHAALKRFWSSTVESSISLKEMRTISVTVGGNAFRTGTYSVPSIATAYNVLWAAGGPTLNGSMRSIEVLRGGQRITIDLYQILAGSAHKGGARGDITLQSGDLIQVPSYDQLVAVEGAVRNSAVYELKTGEGLEAALAYAGGARATATSVQISTVDPGNAFMIKDVKLKDVSVMPQQLYDGDVVEVLAMRPYQNNKVTVEGAVNQPADYALSNGMTVRDLLAEARFPMQDAYLGRAALYRWNPNGTSTLIAINLAKALEGDPQSNIALMKWDRLDVYSQKDAAFAGTGKVDVRGAVQRPGIYPYADNMHVSDLLPKVGGPNPDAEMLVVEHRNGDGTFRYEKASVADIIHGDLSKDFAIQDNDIVALYRNGESSFIPRHEVTISGRVNGQGIYDRGDGMRVADLLQMSGGFRPDAGATVVIAHARRLSGGTAVGADKVTVNFDAQGRCAPQDNIALQDGDIVLVQGVGDFDDKARVVTIEGYVKSPGPIFVSKSDRMSDAITKAGGVLPNGFPLGARFIRNPKLMASDEQRQIARIISDLNDLYNLSAFKRELAKSDLERIKATGAAQTTGSPLGGGASLPNPAVAALATKLSDHDLVSPARTLTDADLMPNGNLAIDLPAALLHPSGEDDIPLLDGDTIYIPEMPTTVQVVGGVVNKSAVKYRPGAPLQYYIDAAGGYAPDAARDHIVIIHANGGLTPGVKAHKLQVGDFIVVPTKVMAEKLSTGGTSFEGLFQQLIGGALVFRLLGL